MPGVRLIDVWRAQATAVVDRNERTTPGGPARAGPGLRKTCPAVPSLVDTAAAADGFSDTEQRHQFTARVTPPTTSTLANELPPVGRTKPEKMQTGDSNGDVETKTHGTEYRQPRLWQNAYT